MTVARQPVTRHHTVKHICSFVCHITLAVFIFLGSTSLITAPASTAGEVAGKEKASSIVASMSELDFLTIASKTVRTKDNYRQTTRFFTPAGEVDDVAEYAQVDEVWQDLNLCSAQLALLSVACDKLSDQRQRLLLANIPAT
jgi:hypothetical protein